MVLPSSSSWRIALYFTEPGKCMFSIHTLKHCLLLLESLLNEDLSPCVMHAGTCEWICISFPLGPIASPNLPKKTFRYNFSGSTFHLPQIEILALIRFPVSEKLNIFNPGLSNFLVHWGCLPYGPMPHWAPGPPPTCRLPGHDPKLWIPWPLWYMPCSATPRVWGRRLKPEEGEEAQRPRTTNWTALT